MAKSKKKPAKNRDISTNPEFVIEKMRFGDDEKELGPSFWISAPKSHENWVRIALEELLAFIESQPALKAAKTEEILLEYSVLDQRVQAGKLESDRMDLVRAFLEVSMPAPQAEMPFFSTLIMSGHVGERLGACPELDADPMEDKIASTMIGRSKCFTLHELLSKCDMAVQGHPKLANSQITLTVHFSYNWAKSITAHCSLGIPAELMDGEEKEEFEEYFKEEDPT